MTIFVFRTFLIISIFSPDAIVGCLSSAFAQALPPVPGRLLDTIQKENHPFLLANAKQIREARRIVRQDLFKDRADEFRQRAVGYFNPHSKWYLGDGPLGESKNFHPMQLAEEDFQVYTKILCEIIGYWGIEKERWASEGLQREFLRILDEIQLSTPNAPASFSRQDYSDRQARMLGLASLIYDQVYSRFDTIDRHPLNNRLNQIRQQLAEDCAAADPSTFSIEGRIARGTALGLSTLLCISIYPYEWQKEGRFSIQSFLPDLYRAISFTQSGMQEMSARSPHISMPLPSLEALVLTAIPWVEALNRFGYPYQIQRMFYGQIVTSFESHRVTQGINLIQPFTPCNLYTPWIPRSEPLFQAVPETMYEKKKNDSESFIPFKHANQTISSASSADSFLIPNSLQSLNVNVQRDGRQNLSLREQLERFGYPRKPTPIPLPREEKYSNPDAGWNPPAGLVLPAVWGALYLLAERDNPASQAGKLWEEYASDIDSHPYTFLFYDEFPMRGKNVEREQSFIQYPDMHATLLSSLTPRGRYLFASQAAQGTLILPTYAIGHESFLLSEGAHEWRWFHEIPSSTAAGENENTIPAASAVESATPLHSSLFSCWQSYSPTGRTILVRRHLGGLGSGYTIAAHYPESVTPGKRVQYVIFSVPENGDVIPHEDVSGLYSIFPSEEELPDRAMSMEMWRMERIAERRGEKKISPGGILNVLFSPDSIKPANAFIGALGRILEADLAEPDRPFFYLSSVDLPGREMYEVKYGNIPLPGMRILQWKQGIEMIAIKTGGTIHNTFVESDADLIVAVRDTSMKAIFYLMVNGSYLRCKFSPTQREFTLLANTKSRPMTAAWCQRRLYTTAPPRSESRFYAPGVLGFECPGFMVQYGQKGDQAVVLGHEPERKRRP